MNDVYDKIKSSENYEVIFGAIILDGGDIVVKSVKGKRDGYHDDYKYQLKLWHDICKWRFVPLTDTCYWWTPVGEYKTPEYEKKFKVDTEFHLRKYYNVEGKIYHKTMLENKLSIMVTHGVPDGVQSDRDPNTFPTFAQWMKFHKDGD